MENIRLLTDEELLSRYYERGESQWLGHLLQRYTLLLLGVSMKYLKNEEAARDNVQQVFLKVIPELSKYRVTYFKSWIYQIAKNHCLMQLRDQKKWGSPLTTDEIPVEGDAAINWQHFTDQEQQFDKLEQALKELAEEQRQCVTLFYLKKMSYRQVADKTGYSIPMVKSYIQNGKRNLRITMTQYKKEADHGR